MVAENSTWGAPGIHGELLMLGFDISERTISRWMKRAPRDPEPAKRWLAFLRNHREAIAAMDFFTVPTITFGVLYCFFIIGHGRRRFRNLADKRKNFYNLAVHAFAAFFAMAFCLLVGRVLARAFLLLRPRLRPIASK
jgi:hypothetical protein